MVDESRTRGNQYHLVLLLSKHRVKNPSKTFVHVFVASPFLSYKRCLRAGGAALLPVQGGVKRRGFRVQGSGLKVSGLI